ncbi:gliding motility protein [Chryseobacterium lactis]|uniref:Gliding motility protein n=1 Tax=Chryseobacterium lactis TaxID=1241981 RepID=A0A3G6RSH8_CHRLC|nr:gliding motility-associated C-terminal domain-containing protein [Chryseobacterium lactis]AZA80946.1 gliding motility-associated C-terminal domain-containing protein [Chryseobacterium lactis]AZB05947.1 gliding motility-associated C-terminal domain-containing protein [Chryseobacterium lactis]PNW13333.1 gliding motility protein [Chryseobacterium lactis]
MNKILLTIFLLLIPIQLLFAQRDTEHWFAPMMKRNTNSAEQQGLYFSTDSTTPFPVEIYNNNILIGTITVSKGNPQVFNVPIQNMITTSQTDLFTPVTMGLYTKGTKPYFVTFRFSSLNHAEILTSKGKAGIGKQFYAAMAPITQTNVSGLNFTTGIMATENNTKVTVSGYSTTVVFSNNTTGATNPSMSFTLNKGQSYIIEGDGNTTENRKGFIGAKIEADKPISVTNGNFNGQFSLASSLLGFGTDIIMDQSVPVDRLGNEFVVVKGNANVDEQMEDALIIATENNTQVFINNATTPAVTLNEGQSYRVNELSNTNYINQGNNHYNMYIRTTKNVYVYQLLAGVANDSGRATGGFNYIPPLNCFLPRKIDEIGMINILPPTTNTVKLNILTETGAAVTVNGATPPAAQGPYPVSGTSNWVSYSVPNVTGNITVASTKAVTAGISGGSGAVGYGGYFAGFSSIPVIAKQNGECIPGLVLEIDDSFDTYQWYRNNTLITGATSNSYTPTQSGNYTVKITIGTCPPVTTPVYKVYTCVKKTTINDTLCDGAKQYTPNFTSSTQTVVPGTVTIITPPTNGTAVINPTTGVITYTPNTNYSGPDTVVYKFCGNNPDFTDCEEVTLKLTVSANPVVNDTSLRTCFLGTNAATGLFDLTTANVTTTTNITKKYYPSLADAQAGTNEILNPTTYTAPTGVVYVRVTNANGCYRIAQVTLTVMPPVKSDVLVDKIICMEGKTTLDAGPGFKSYEWSTGATTQVINNAGVGTYWVKLKTGECITTQTVKIYASEHPVITNIDISGNTVTIYVIGGTPPYKYSVDNINWQDSNVFTNMPRGNANVYVKDNYNCNPINIEITIANLINVITPNEDGINDVIDYSSFAIKKNLVISIFDRYGAKIFQADKSNGYKWNGTSGGKTKVPTGSYWYEISWNEPNSKQTAIKYTGWILVKNRE